MREHFDRCGITPSRILQWRSRTPRPAPRRRLHRAAIEPRAVQLVHRGWFGQHGALRLSAARPRPSPSTEPGPAQGFGITTRSSRHAGDRRRDRPCSAKAGAKGFLDGACPDSNQGPRIMSPLLLTAGATARRAETHHFRPTRWSTDGRYFHIGPILGRLTTAPPGQPRRASGRSSLRRTARPQPPAPRPGGNSCIRPECRLHANPMNGGLPGADKSAPNAVRR